MVRDTQRCKPLRERAKTKFPGLRKLAAMELGLEIQKASHSSVRRLAPFAFDHWTGAGLMGFR